MASVVISGDTSGSVTITAPAVAGTPTLTLPTTTDTLVGKATTDTLTNKTLTSPTISTINLTGGQIAFPATQSASANANTLDDYEEGTWTPVATPASGSSTFSTSGVYTKVGNIVTLYASITITNADSGGGLLNLSGYPFNSKDNAPYYGVCRESAATGVIYYMGIAGVTGAIQNLNGGYPVWTTNLVYKAVITLNVD